jgi:UDP-N-acetylmuramoyl-tripeptide--D-alanyl-D-alanine ligase
LLCEAYSVCFTPQSYNTPIGVAKTVLSDDFDGKEIFIAEMGARRKGEIAELCQMVQPDYALLTGICGQHIETFGSIQAVAETKAEVLAYADTVLCLTNTRQTLAENGVDVAKVECINVGATNIQLSFDKTAFDLPIYGKMFHVETTLLGKAAVENVSLAVALCEKLQFPAEKIMQGIAKLEPIPHRLSLLKENGIYILDDAYNANEKSALAALDALGRFTGRKVVVTPGIVETGALDKKVNGAFGGAIACSKADDVLLIGETQLQSVKDGYFAAGGTEDRLHIFPALDKAQVWLQENIREGDAVLFLNDLPDVY